jgi:hypothetical protein
VTFDVRGTLMPGGPPKDPDGRREFFELYQIMVTSSESLVGRRQAVNTFFLTINGLLLTAVGLFVRSGGDGHNRLEAAAICVLALTGITLCVAWATLIISFGQLNTGKFAIINEMEKELAASIFAAEWEALERGENPKVYRTFTSREIWVPRALVGIYLLTAVLSGIVAIGWWSPSL